MDINCDMIKNVLKLFIFVLSSFFFYQAPQKKIYFRVFFNDLSSHFFSEKIC